VEALDEGAGDEIPAVDEDEQENLERQGDEDRGSITMPMDMSVEATTMSMTRNGKEDEKADLNAVLSSTRERGDEDVRRDVLAGLRAVDLRQAREEGEVGLTRLAEHELAHRALRAVECLDLVDPAGVQRVPGLRLDVLQRRLHDEDRQEEGDPDEDLVRRRGRGAQARAG